ncbi:hypothetical protein X975_06420, partial [Stegodyphus mimosarum]
MEEYPRRRKPIYKRARKLPFSHRYPKIFYCSVVGISGLIFFSRPIYDIMFRPPTIDPLTLDPETR